MSEELKDENNYFRIVVKEAINDLKDKGKAFVFFEEQLEILKKQYENELNVKIDNGIFYITDTKKKKGE